MSLLIKPQLKKEKKLLTSNSPAAINFPEKKIKPAIIIPVKVSIIGVARTRTLFIFIFFYSIIFALILIYFLAKYAQNQRDKYGKQIPTLYLSILLIVGLPFLTFLLKIILSCINH